ncbi:LysR family transcriptional regulator [Hymenobacter sp. HMF4947]|uniref:LysR family transcriptional regulator n=1 Tax=Hymenobacter ginkgonis TaxID=2682976 RepID=A0A7K1TCB6_9BACT|nr:LysR substrate-binding domain-containing protein [Hymenobacter ginkgonis]MVN76047.1 LysR family transcriptional regulator [Hymenobacter ginkgonis]
MELRQLRYFAEVATERHYGRAATKLCVSQPALSQQIQLLESELGVELFDHAQRTRQRKVVLTEAGTVFLAEAQRLLHLSRQAIEAVRRVGSQQKTVELGYYQLLRPDRLVGIVQRFNQSFPDVQFHLHELPTFRAVQEALMAETIDLGLTMLPLLHPELAARPFGQGGLAVALPTAHPLATAAEVPLAALAHERWVEISRPLHPVYDEIEHLCQQAGFSRRGAIVQEVSSLELLSNLVSLGIGIAFVPSFFDLSQVPGVVARPLHVASGDALTLTQCVAYLAARPAPLLQALVGLV